MARDDASLVVKVGPPSGGDDTAVLQAALGQCVAHAGDCRVHLSAGTYRTRQLVTYDFRGTFEGEGPDRTVVAPLGTLEVCPDACVGHNPDTTRWLWPDLVIFVDGQVRISRMAFHLDQVPATTGWFGITALISAVRVMSSREMAATVEEVTIQGSPDDSPESYGGFNAANCITVAGELYRDDSGDQYPLTGNFRLSGNSFSTCLTGITVFRALDSRVVIGGGPSSGNSVTDVFLGMEIANFDNSTGEISDNFAEASFLADVVIYNPRLPSPQKTSHFSIHDNHFGSGPGGGADGLLLIDNSAAPRVIDASVVHNTVSGDGLYGMIRAVRTDRTLIAGNRLSGSALWGIAIESGTEEAIVGNNVAAVTAELARISLDKDTTRSLVAGACARDDVVDEGQGNTVICRGR